MRTSVGGQLELGRRAGRRRRQRDALVGRGSDRRPEHLGDRVEVARLGGLVEGDPDVRAVVAEIEPRGFGRLPDTGDRGDVADIHAQRVEVGGVALRDAEQRQPRLERDRLAVDPAGDGREPLGAVVHGIERGDVGEERLRGADVRGRLLAADVLLARLDRHPVGGLAVPIDGHADQAAGHLADVGVARGEERRVRTAVAERDAEALGAADDDVGAHLARRRDERARQQIGRDDGERLGVVDTTDDRREIADEAVGIRRLEQHAVHVRADLGGRDIDDAQLEAERLGTRGQQLQRLRERRAIREEHPRVLARAHAVRQRHAFRRGGRLVEQRRVGDVHRGEILHHGLEVEERLEAALRDLGLVRRVRRVPAGVLEDVAQDRGRRDRVVVAEADERPEDLVLRRDGPQAREVVVLALGRRQRQRIAAPDRGRDGLVEERLDGRRADDGEHLGLLGRARADVPGREARFGRGRGDRRRLQQFRHQPTSAP